MAIVRTWRHLQLLGHTVVDSDPEAIASQIEGAGNDTDWHRNRTDDYVAMDQLTDLACR